jgi:hypothetical protein
MDFIEENWEFESRKQDFKFCVRYHQEIQQERNPAEIEVINPVKRKKYGIRTVRKSEKQNHG